MCGWVGHDAQVGELGAQHLGTTDLPVQGGLVHDGPQLERVGLAEQLLAIHAMPRLGPGGARHTPKGDPRWTHPQ